MIKAEVVVDGDWLKIGNRSIRMNQYLDWVVLLDGVAENNFAYLKTLSNIVWNKNMIGL